MAFRLIDGHVDCPCWTTGKYVWVKGCEHHPVRSPFEVYPDDADVPGWEPIGIVIEDKKCHSD